MTESPTSRRPGYGPAEKRAGPLQPVERVEEYGSIRFEFLECFHIDRRWVSEPRAIKRRCPLCAEEPLQSAIEAERAFLDELLDYRAGAKARSRPVSARE